MACQAKPAESQARPQAERPERLGTGQAVGPRHIGHPRSSITEGSDTLDEKRFFPHVQRDIHLWARSSMVEHRPFKAVVVGSSPTVLTRFSAIMNNSMSTADLYDLDFAAWAELNAGLLRAGRLSEVDLEHVAEEIEDLSRRQRHAVRSRLGRLIRHLLKWQFQPEKRSTSWQRTIAQQRLAISRLLEESASLKPRFAGQAAEAYSDGARLAAIEMRCEVKALPSSCPYTMAQLLDLDYLP
jgi:hypothetical protein